MGWFSRASKGSSGRDGLDDLSSGVFEQNEYSLLGEALRKPIGLLSALLLVVSAGFFIANQFYLYLDRLNDFALVGFFVGGGVLLSVLLRAGDSPSPSVSIPKKSSTVSSPAATRAGAASQELIMEYADAALAAPEKPKKTFLERRKKASTKRKETFPEKEERGLTFGFAEASPAKPPVPPEALVEPEEIVAAPDHVDDEVANFQQALVHYVDTGDFHGQGEVLRRLGHLAKSRGHLKESRQFYMNARACFRKIDDHYAEAAVLLDLGQVLESLDEHDAASAAYRDANRALLDVAMNAGDRYNAVQAHAAD